MSLELPQAPFEHGESDISNLGFVHLWNPDEYEGRIAGLECTLRGFHDRTIQAVAVCEGTDRRKRREAMRYYHCYRP